MTLNNIQQNDIQQNDIQQNDIQQNDIQQNDIQQNDSQKNYIQHNYIQKNVEKTWSHILLRVIPMNVVRQNAMSPFTGHILNFHYN